MRLVQKFGGTSVATIARLEKVALTVKSAVDEGWQVAVVVSAMAGVTNTLVEYTRALTAVSAQPEYDAIVSTGEPITAGLLALALNQIGLQARSFQGWQIPILTCQTHAQATIQKIVPSALEECLRKGIVPVICGFQGVTEEGRITTLGRGGSDTTAVALASALKAQRCDIYTDVEGIYTADPRVVPKARKLSEITYKEMKELAHQGAKVLHSKCVEMAQKQKVKVQVLSSFTKNPGTFLVPMRSIKTRAISGVTYSSDCCCIQFKTLGPAFVTENKLSLTLNQAQIYTDMICRTEHTKEEADIIFIIGQGDIPQTVQVLEQLKETLQISDLILHSDVAKITVVGLNMQSSYCLLSGRIRKSLEEEGINSQLIYYSQLKFSLLTQKENAEQAVQILHTELGLEREG